MRYLMNNPIIMQAPSALGKLSLSYLILLYIPIIILTPLYTNYMAVTQKQQKPYPAATITSTACHYPQDIVFRYTMLIASSILALIFFAIFKWIKYVADLVGFTKKISNGYYYASMFSVLMYGITIGTIDQKSTGNLHGPCAVIFFIILLIVTVVVTLYLTEMRAFDTRALSYWSLKAKQAMAWYVVAVWIYCLIQIILVSDLNSPSDKYVNIVEWNTVIFLLVWVLTYATEWKYFKLVLVGEKSEIRTVGTIGPESMSPPISDNHVVEF